jgi:hypothetical protein
MEIKKSSRRAGIAIVVAGLIVGLMPSVANAADSGWRANPLACIFISVGGVSISVDGGLRYASADDGSAPGSVGLRVHYGTLVSSPLWAGQKVVWTTPYDISQYLVSH